MKKSTSFFYRNGLSLVLFTLMLLFWVFQAITGWKDHNNELPEYGSLPLTFAEYLGSGPFRLVATERVARIKAR